MSARVSCVGVAVLDFIYNVERLPSADGKIVAHSLIESGGGMAANAAATIVRLGGHAAWFGRVGGDQRVRLDKPPPPPRARVLFKARPLHQLIGHSKSSASGAAVSRHGAPADRDPSIAAIGEDRGNSQTHTDRCSARRPARDQTVRRYRSRATTANRE